MRHTLRSAALTLIGIGTVALISGLLVAVRFARRVVTPPGNQVYDTPILGISVVDEEPQSVLLPRTPDAELTGEYSLVAPGGNSLMNLGEVVAADARTVRRRVMSSVGAPMRVGDFVKFCGWSFLTPEPLGYSWQEVLFAVDGTELPAWMIEPKSQESNVWAVHIHGRATRRGEALRSAKITAGLGMPSLVVTYRNDEELEGQARDRYALGAEEWRDVEPVLEYALAHGAKRVVLYGWSMGASLSLQLIRRSKHRDRIAAAVFDSPALDWQSVLTFHGRLSHLPRWVIRVGVWMLESGFVRSGATRGIPFHEMNAEQILRESHVPVLVLHSADDGYVPIDPADRLQAALESVTLIRYQRARHVKLWNTDPHEYEAAVSSWLGKHTGSTV